MKETRRRGVGAVALSLLVGIIGWSWPVLWPLKLLVVMIHETGHAVATWLVGGRVERVVIAANESGQCVSALPPGTLRQIVIYSAGYVGSAATGALLLVATLRWGVRRPVLIVMSGWLAVMGVLYAGDAFTLAFCLWTAAVLGAAARWLGDSAVEPLCIFIAAFTGLYALFDLRDDLWNSAARAHSDAALLADLTYVPAVVWAVVWSFLALAVLAVAAWWALRPRRAGGRVPVPATAA